MSSTSVHKNIKEGNRCLLHGLAKCCIFGSQNFSFRILAVVVKAMQYIYPHKILPSPPPPFQNFLDKTLAGINFCCSNFLNIIHASFRVFQVCLFDLGSVYWQLENWRKDLWELSRIGIPDDDKESRDSIVFGNLIYWFLKEVSPVL